MKNLSQFPEIMSAKEVAEYLSISYAKALHLLKYGNLPCIKIGHVFKISRKVFEIWVNEPNKKVLV